MNGICAFGLVVVCLVTGVLFDSPRWSASPVAVSSERLSADFRANPLLAGFRPIGRSDGWDAARRQMIVGPEGWSSAPFTVWPGECVQLFVECPDEQEPDAAVQASRLTYALTGYYSSRATEVFSERGEFIAGEFPEWHSKLVRFPPNEDSPRGQWTLEVTLRSDGDLPVRIVRMKVTASALAQELDRR